MSEARLILIGDDEALDTLAELARYLPVFELLRQGELPERALDGDEAARSALTAEVYEPLLSGGHALLDTLTTYLEQGSSLEATARLLFVHPNTVRYRLRRVAEVTDYTPSAGRDGFTLWVAVALGRLAAKRS